MAGGYICGINVPTPAMPCAGKRMRVRVWGVRVASVAFGSGTTAGHAAPIISEGRAFNNWHDTR